MKEKLWIQTYEQHDFVFREAADRLAIQGSSSWHINSLDLAKVKPYGKEVLYFKFGDNAISEVFTTGDLVVKMTLTRKQLAVAIAGNTVESIENFITHLKEKFPIAQEAGSGLIDLKFHFSTQSGPQYISRRIAVPDWKEIQSNYEASTKKKLEHLFNNFKAAHGGQLILFQGEPGTGKSFALRALCDAWKDWCSVEYIVDPDAFFGGSSSYLMKLLGNSSDMYDEDDEDEDDSPRRNKEKEWKLFILEDTGELLTENAKDRVGQGLGRLLNVVDGFIGQGLRILILITSNEDLGKLHPAVSRPGRTAAIVKFNPLDAAHAKRWAKENNVKLPSNKSYTLAELFSIADEFENKSQEVESTLGFRMPVEVG